MEDGSCGSAACRHSVVQDHSCSTSAMDRRTSSLRAAALTSKAAWNRVQVEFHGEFPVDHIKQFEQYSARTSWLRALLVCLLTPVPVVLVAVLVEAIPLEDPETHNARQSPHHWLRCVVTVFIATVCWLEQFRQHIPSLELSRWVYPGISLVSAVLPTAFIFVLADNVVFPFPFGATLSTVPYTWIVVGLLFRVVRRQLREKPQLIKDLRCHVVVVVCQCMMAYTYPIFSAVYIRASPWGQSVMILVLPVIKLAAKNCISRWIANSDESRPESVVFNVEVFHSLYVSFTMQNATAIHTIVAIMAVDLIQALISLNDIYAMLTSIKTQTDKLPASQHGPLIRHVVDIHEANRQGPSHLRDDDEVMSFGSRETPSLTKVHPASSSQPAKISGVRTALVAPSVADATSVAEHLSDQDRELLVQKTQKLLYVTEFVALDEFTEVLMPCIFNLYILVMYHFPNRQFYSFLRDLTTDQLSRQITTVFVYASLELASLAIIAVLLWRKLRLSVLHLIAFVLETRQASVHAKLVFWALSVLQTHVQQAGGDYTFEFAWIKAKQTGS